MRRQEFQDALDRFGDDLGRWPVADRVRAETLLRDDPASAVLLAEGRRMRVMLAASAPIRAPAGLADRIVGLARASSPPLPHVVSPPTADAGGQGRLDAAMPHQTRPPGDR
jgi:hypothetical protein